MLSRQSARLGILSIVVSLGFLTFFSLLATYFHYPEILDQPTATILQTYQKDAALLRVLWYGLLLSSLGFIPLVVALNNYLKDGSKTFYGLLVAGVAAGVFQSLGLLRWTFLVPNLAQSFVDPNSSEIQRLVSAQIFDSFHNYWGRGVGEHLGYLFTSIWTALAGFSLYRRKDFRLWGLISSCVLAIGIAIGLLNPLGWPVTKVINAISYSIWGVLLLIVGVRFLIKKRDNASL